MAIVRFSMPIVQTAFSAVVIASSIIVGHCLTPVGPRAAAAQQAPAAKSETDFTPPASDKASDLFAFVERIKKSKPPTDAADPLEHLRKVCGAVIAAVDRVGVEAGEAEQVRAVEEKLAASWLLRRLDGAAGAAQFDRVIAQLSADKRPQVAPLVRGYKLRMRLSGLAGNPADLPKLLSDVREHVRTSKPDEAGFALAYHAAQAAENAGLLREAADAYIDFAAAFAASEDRELAAKGEQFAGAARLLSLVGNPIDLKGKLLDGESFDWAKYRGKVVLVDYWATWCGPCIAELPNLREIYSKYHERGLEIVTISLDDDKARLTSFVERESFEWPVLFSEEAGQTGWDHPLARYYGIAAIPRAILVDREGKVVSIAAHGEALWALLAKQIGPPVVKKPEGEEGKPAEAKPGEAEPEKPKPAQPKPAEPPA
jgi:thiol-disulfide isomerase/thioredoxin